MQNLKKTFIHNGAIRVENPGVVIGLGEGWTHMKTNGQQMWKISKKDPYPDHLALVPGRPIGQVIRGGHHTEAVKLMAAELEKEEEAYWCYHVLLPGKSLIFLSLTCLSNNAENY